MMSPKNYDRVLLAILYFGLAAIIATVTFGLMR